MLANFNVWGIRFLLRAVLNILVRNASPRGPMCFRCLIFSLSGPCELLYLLSFIAYWTWEVVSVILYPCMFCVALSMDLFVLCVACLTVFVNCLVIQFAICLGVFAILLLKVMELLCVVGGALLDRPLPYCRLWLWHPRSALTNCKSCRMQHWERSQCAHSTKHTTSVCRKKRVLPIHEHLQLHASQYKQKTQTYNIFNTARLNLISSTTAATHQTYP